MTNDQSAAKLSRSSSSTANVDHNVNQGVLVGHDDHDVIASPIPTGGESLDLNNNSENFIPNTALVLGLAAAACFLLLVVYIILKVHFCNKKKPNPKHNIFLPKISSGVENTAFHGETTLTPINTIQQRDSVVHSIEFNHQSSELPTLTEPASGARLTGARFLSGQ